MATPETAFLHDELEERKRRLQTAMAVASPNADLAGLLHEVDSALERMAQGSYGLCQECHEPVEPDRLLARPASALLSGPPNRTGTGCTAA